MEEKPSPTTPTKLYTTQGALGNPATLPFSRIGADEGRGSMYPVIIDSPSSHWLPTEFRCPAASKFKLRARGFLAGTSQFSLRDLTRPHETSHATRAGATVEISKGEDLLLVSVRWPS